MTFFRQAAFDTALNGLRKQGRRSINGDMCCYRSDDGCRCAVGFLIPDSAYVRRMEGMTAGEELIFKSAGGGHFGDGRFLTSMQFALHDGLHFKPGGFHAALERGAAAFAAEYGLTYTGNPRT